MGNVISVSAFANGLNKYQIRTNIDMQGTYFVGFSFYTHQANNSAHLLQKILVLRQINYEHGLKCGEN